MSLTEEIAEVIGNFDGNSIIYTDYDTEPYITETALKNIAKAITTLIQGKIPKEKHTFQGDYLLAVQSNKNDGYNQAIREMKEGLK